ncbi:ABC transporter ATP-binding protein [Bacillaceae bacterium SIJ1]|uniref:ABC transporter ATP-binding protein n=1 Tax=Litoribacterium kuwaitense TaxID=1398745 RepID=UPI0013EDBCCE|nr:ABC transporter ATP-binding protein [Litoribacterium kuwaitense]NGP44803.1 ABC transporter ATP-binding protein [Litoribacterium kuwaitense]
MIDVQHVSCSIQHKSIIQDVSFTVQQGEMFGLLGPNGAGKSTLLSALATLKPLDHGHILIDGIDLSIDPKKARSRLGFVPQDIAVWQNLSVLENLKIWQRLSGSLLKKEQVSQIASEFGLNHLLTKKVRTLSGGMKRKLNMAIAFLHHPAVVLLDEPTVGIDLPSKNEINRLLREKAMEGLTVIYTTHDMHEILTVCDRFAILTNGRITFCGTLEEAFKEAKQYNNEINKQEDAILALMEGSH